jgi:tRNA uridine 5-carboxymethylaminomethyl modification enzyme
VFHVKQSDFDVIVVGAGHAGIEAAAAAARMGSRTALITMRKDDLGVLSCNPAIGGLGKGHLVREIDALDGLMGRIADASGIQFRLLNRSKGPAVQGPRAQMDRAAYARATQEHFEAVENADLLLGEVVDLIVERDAVVRGVELADGQRLNARSVVLCTGTFLGGKILLGEESWPAGRDGASASLKLGGRLRDLDLRIGRMKTGTPPRLLGQSIDWNRVSLQPGDPDPVLFSFLSDRIRCPQIACGITRTNERTHDVVRSNLSRSPMYSGRIEGVGPRYCPSIEDKIARFADKSSHQIFLEPEGHTSDLVYPNGISTSLPADVQATYVRTIEGLEAVEIVRPGYAIEYDFADPRALNHGLGLTQLRGLFLAGQINGTTGYEEAGAQGLVAGLNAAQHAVDGDPVHFDRATSYIGVMIDDLVSRGVTEPYRMFTSRAEYRLSLRADNADARLTEFGHAVGCVSLGRMRIFERKSTQISQLTEILRDRTARKSDIVADKAGRSKESRSLYSLMSDHDVSVADVRGQVDGSERWAGTIWDQVARNALYANYEDRQRREAEALQRDAMIRIPDALDYASVGSLSTEARVKLDAARPATLRDAARIEGVTPAALLAIRLHIERGAVRVAAS